jgi:hypothetical protein
MRRTLAVLAVAAAVLTGLATPAAATCMQFDYPGGVRVVYCSAPGGPVTTYVCYRDTCVPLPSAGGGGGHS